MGKVIVGFVYFLFCAVNVGVHALFLLWVAKKAKGGCQKPAIENDPVPENVIPPVTEMTKEEIVNCLESNSFLAEKQWEVKTDDAVGGYLLTVKEGNIKKIYKVIPFARTRTVSLQHFATTAI